MPTNRNCPLKHCQLPNPNCHKARRIKAVIEDEPLMEFGTRRPRNGCCYLGTRAAFIGGASATSNVRAGKIFGIPVAGTHAHALVQTYGDDYKAFKAYAETHHDCVFLVDTYDTLRIGVPAPSRLPKKWEIRLTSKGFGLIQAIWPIFPRKFVSN